MKNDEEFKEALKGFDNKNWQEVYNHGFVKMEKVVPFQAKLKHPDYRFRYVLKRINAFFPDGLDSLSALDVGCGNGTLAYLMTQKGLKVTGVDVSDTAIEACKGNVPEAEFVQAHCDQELPFPSNHFDVVTSLEVIEHVKDLDKCVAELVRVTKPGGLLLVTTPVGKAYDNPLHIRYFRFYDVTDLFEKFVEKFKICRIFKISEREDDRKLWAIQVMKE